MYRKIHQRFLTRGMQPFLISAFDAQFQQHMPGKYVDVEKPKRPVKDSAIPVQPRNIKAHQPNGTPTNLVRIMHACCCPSNSSSRFHLCVVPHVASDIRKRNHPTSIVPQVDQMGIGNIFIRAGLNVMPLVLGNLEKAKYLVENEVKEKQNESRVDSPNVNLNVHNDKRLDAEMVLKSAPKRDYSDVEMEGWKLLPGSVVTYCGNRVGTVAANDPANVLPLNYDQVFIRGFVPSALAFVLSGEGEIVKNFLLQAQQLQSWEKSVDCYSPGEGLMPASFKVRTLPLEGRNGELEGILGPDFGESAIGRVAPVISTVMLSMRLTRMFPVTLACIKMGRPPLEEKRLQVDQWPEYQDARYGKFIGKQARLYQTGTVAGYLSSKLLLDNPDTASLLFWNEDSELLENCVWTKASMLCH